MKEAKQAEFLMHGSFPWGLIEELGVISPAVRDLVEGIIEGLSYRPPVNVRPEWYY